MGAGGRAWNSSRRHTLFWTGERHIENSGTCGTERWKWSLHYALLISHGDNRSETALSGHFFTNWVIGLIDYHQIQIPLSEHSWQCLNYKTSTIVIKSWSSPPLQISPWVCPCWDVENAVWSLPAIMAISQPPSRKSWASCHYWLPGLFSQLPNSTLPVPCSSLGRRTQSCLLPISHASSLIPVFLFFWSHTKCPCPALLRLSFRPFKGFPLYFCVSKLSTYV